MIINALKDGEPTGRLNSTGNMMEVHCYAEEGTQRLRTGSRWVPVTEEQRRQIISGNTAVVSSMGYTVDHIQQRRLYSDDLSDGPAASSAEAQKLAGLVLRLDPNLKSNEVRVVQGLKIDSYNLTPEGIGLRGTADEFEPSSSDLDNMVDAFQKAELSPPGISLSEHLKALDVEEREEDRRQPEHSGGRVNYYSVPIEHPTRPDRPPYIMEVQDVIIALNMTFDEGTIFKSLIRSCTERELGLKKLGGDSIRDAEKMVFSSQETLRQRKLRSNK